ncbi:MAG: hypothetical protein B7O98_09045 [Zestosphaera tikiterensis]|uniref:Predicted DNA-binding protein ribbon-helix-helix domain-containing protein n=1 Tax=Zestosphaera tikiterensis TaxID=1973259 RepID=A0A2R7Y282_9CREN|nr:MAG: hypothetical protein B7O98_09045 [Zestosphaera tikiterensis]
MVKVKTSIYVDRELWERFKKYALRKGVEVSKLLEEMVRDEMIEETLDEALLSMVGSEDYEIDFKPIKPGEGLVSELIRVAREEGASDIRRQ